MPQSKSDSRLRRWANENQPSREMLYHDAFRQQIGFIGDRIAGLLSRTHEECCDLVDVVGSHRSKSITLPVYHIVLRQDGAQFWLRNNFHNWNVSAQSARPLCCDFLDCFDDTGSYLFMEGMEDKRFGSYAIGPDRFSVCVWSDCDLYVFFRAVKKFFGIKPADM